ncbi:hypothetical protein [Plantactinospora sp. B5E13]|uniref:hypothetical protein n=1 Tax=unclassified Plantactinospora TaxID=2631981 RepID=UPI00325CF6C2
MIGPVQLMIIGFDGRQIPAPLLEKLHTLRAEPAVHILDALAAHKNRDGTIETEGVPDLLPDPAHEPGAILDRLMARAGAAGTMGQTSNTGPSYLFRSDALPDPRTAASGTSSLALLLEHRWAAPLRDAATEVDAYPIDTGWLGQNTLTEVGLLPDRQGWRPGSSVRSPAPG